MTGAPPYDSELVSLHVRRMHQGRGVGQALFRAAAQELQRSGCRSLMLWVLEQNQSARGFYERLGGILLEPPKPAMGMATEVAYGWASLEQD